MAATHTAANPAAARMPAWRQATAPYQQADLRRSLWQLATSVVPYLVLWYLMYRSLAVSYWLTLLLAFPTAGFLMRIFIIFHDCGHGSFFKSQRANNAVGIVTGVLSLTPYYQWRHDHAMHHATSGDLDRRGAGDVWMLTVEEYRAAPTPQKLAYRIFRNPAIMLLLGPFGMFGIAHRFPTGNGGRRERTSVWATDAALLGIAALLCWTIGLRALLLVQLPLMLLAGSLGIWMFYVQHQYPGVCWVRHDRWNYVESALQGSSYYRVPGLINWFTGNIGLHHIHHLNSRIPNYNLAACYKANPMLQIAPLTVRASLAALRYRLWDEAGSELVGYPKS